MRPIFTLFVLFAFAACKKSGDTANKAPQSFTVSATEVKPTSAQLNWTIAKDPENETVTYSVELKGQSLTTSLTTTSYKLENLTENTSYTGKVIAKDASGNTTESAFSFSTANSPSPSAFTVTMYKANYKSIEVMWNASTLPDNGVVTYDVYVNNLFRAGGFSTQNYLITGLQPQTQYNIKVIAKSAAGKSTESTLQSSTTVNQAPGAFTISKTEAGVNTVTIAGTKPVDPEQEQLSYFTIIDGVEKQVYPTNTSATTFSYRIEGLNGGQQYNIAVKVKDEGGAAVTSNTLSVTTSISPENNFAITPAAEGTKVAVEFVTATQLKINETTSQYLVGNDWKYFGSAQITYTDMPDNKTKIKILIDDAELRTLYNVKFQLSLRWAPDNITTTSLLVYYTHFTATSARVSVANIVGPGIYPPQWSVAFENCVISDYSSYDIREIVFDNVSFSSFLGTAICDPTKIGYYTGNATVAQYTYLKTKNSGYVIVKDAGGYHKLNFTYTWQD